MIYAPHADNPFAGKDFDLAGIMSPKT